MKIVRSLTGIGRRADWNVAVLSGYDNSALSFHHEDQINVSVDVAHF